MKKMCYFEVDCHPKEALVVATKVLFALWQHVVYGLWFMVYCIKGNRHFRGERKLLSHRQN